jgi:hypothetical protein
MSPEPSEPGMVQDVQQPDLFEQSSVTESSAPPIEEAQPIVCETLADAALILMADNWKLFDTLERLLKKKALKGFITFLDLSAFRMKCKNDETFASVWTEDELKAVQMLKDNWKDKGPIDLKTIASGRNRVLCLDKDALSRLTDFSGNTAAAESLAAADSEMAFDSFRASSTQDAANKVASTITSIPQKLLDAMTVRQGDGYWQVSERMLALAGVKPTNQEVWNLMKALLTAHETSGASAQGYLKVGEMLPIDDGIKADAGFRRIVNALATSNEEFSAPTPNWQNAKGIGNPNV